MNPMIQRTSKAILGSALVLLLGIGLTACSDTLSVDPEQSISADQAFAALQNAEAALTGAYDQLQDGGVYGGHMVPAGDFTAGTAQFSGSFATWQNTRDFNKNSAHGPSEAMYAAHYEMINRTNNVIERSPGLVDNDEAADSSDVDRLVGQAKFLRALGYFNLVRLYGEPINEVEDQPMAELDFPDNAGVPLVLEPTDEVGPNLDVPRSSVEDVYGQIVSDLDDAIDRLGSDGQDGVRANAPAAQALLAKVRLYQGQWDNAESLASQVIDSGVFSLSDNPNAPFLQGSGNAELIFAVRNTVEDNSGVNAFPTSFYLPDALGGRGEISIVNSFADQFEDGDLRGFGGESEPEGNFGMYEFPEGSGTLHPNKWTSSSNADDIPVLRLAEMYLIAAEGAARGSGSDADARSYLNTVRERANASPVSSSLSGQDLIDEIIDERRRELAFEGDQYFDIKRLGLPLESFSGAFQTAPPSQRVYPIPSRERDVNDNLAQNPGY